jgi:hypothetical protein
VFSPHDLADLEAEARLLGQLLHKNIVSATAACRVEPTRCCLVTELAPFGSLKSVLDRVAEREACAAVCPSCGAASVLHTSTIVHPRHQAGQPARLQSLVERNRRRQADRLGSSARVAKGNQQGRRRRHADGVEQQVRPRRVPDWFAALVRRMWAPDAATRPSCRTLCWSSTRNDAHADDDSDRDDRSSVDEIVRKLSLRGRHHGKNATTRVNDSESCQSDWE